MVTPANHSFPTSFKFYVVLGTFVLVAMTGTSAADLIFEKLQALEESKMSRLLGASCVEAMDCRSIPKRVLGATNLKESVMA